MGLARRKIRRCIYEQGNFDSKCNMAPKYWLDFTHTIRIIIHEYKKLLSLRRKVMDEILTIPVSCMLQYKPIPILSHCPLTRTSTLIFLTS